MNNTPTPRERFRKTLDISTGVSELLADSNASYIHWLEKELITVTKERDRLAEAIRKYTSGNYPESFLSKTLRSLNQPTP